MTVPMIKSIGDVPYPIDTHSDAFSPLLTAGAALGITSNVTESAAWLQRVSTSDGPTTVKSIKGRTLGWNQLAPVPFRNQGTSYGITYTPNSDGSMTLSGTATQVARTRIGTITTIVGHKYAVYMGGTIPASNDVYIYNDNGGIVTNTSAKVIATATAANSVYVRISSDATVDGTLHPQIFDLTAMFGAGNEPSTVAEFEALFPEPYYEYDTGSLMSVNMEGIATEDADGNPLQSRTIPAGTLRGAGTVYDELTETERITRVGVFADLGTLTWVYAADTDIMYANVQSAITDALLGTAQIETVAPHTSIYFTSDNHFLCLKGTGYTDAAAFKTAMNGVAMFYPLATPTVTTHEQPLNMTYRTAAGGTERVMVPTGENSAPPTIVAAQGYTAESLRDAALSCIAPVENGTASTNYGVGSYLVHGGQLCRVTTAIATGEAITIGTNVTATTVMAEVIALAQ